MLIKESKLRQIIKSVIRESISGNRRRLKESDADEYLPNGSHVMGSVPTYVADEQAQAEGMEAWYASNSMPPKVGDEIRCPTGSCEYTTEGWQYSSYGPADPDDNYYGPSDEEVHAYNADSLEQEYDDLRWLRMKR